MRSIAFGALHSDRHSIPAELAASTFTSALLLLFFQCTVRMRGFKAARENPATDSEAFVRQ